MANIENSIQIALAFAKKWEQLASKSPNKTSYFSKPDSVAGDTIVYSYQDGSKGRSIGWGTYNKLSDGTKVTKDLTITKSDSDYEIETEMRKKESDVRKQFDIEALTDTQYAAILDYAYNAGAFAFNRNGLKDAIENNGDVESALKGASITQDGVVISNLKDRRKDEAQLWSGNYNELYSYYLRNATKINYIAIGTITIALSVYMYWLIKHKFKLKK